MDLILKRDGDTFIILDDTMGNRNKIAEFRDAVSYGGFVQAKLRETNGNMTLYSEDSESYIVERPKTTINAPTDPVDAYGDRPFFWPDRR